MPPPKFLGDFRPATGPEPSFWDTLTASFQDQQVKNTTEEKGQLGAAVDDAWRKLNDGLGDQERKRLSDLFIQSGNRRGNAFEVGRSGNNQEMSTDPTVMRMWAMQAYRNSLPEAQRESIPSADQLTARGRELSLARYFNAQDVLSRAPDNLMGGTAKFVGGAGGAMTDPFNVVSMAALRYPATSILKTIGIEAAGGMLTQAAIEPITAKYMNDIGVDYDLNQSIESILMAGVGAGAISGLWRGGEKAFVRATGGIPIDELRKKAIRLGADPDVFDSIVTADRKAATSIVRDAQLLDSENPFQDALHRTVLDRLNRSAEASERHITETVRADETMQNGAPTTPAPAGPPPAVAGSRTPEGVEVVDLGTLRRDPMVFQYKESDIEGVTPALKGVDSWAPERAGLLIVWERADGTRYVVDGHQRHALAQRLVTDGHAPIAAPVFVLREVDGVSAAQARVKAAVKNMGEGSGSSLDAAYIMREADAADLRGLPPNSGLVKEAAGLARLSDDAFGMVVNDVADPRWGSLVGRLVEDTGLQAQVLAAVQRMNPASPSAAESMIRDMIAAPRVEVETMDLFGSANTSHLLIEERAKVKAAALAVTAKNRNTFRIALGRQVELEAAGNRLAAQRNREALDAETAAALRLEQDAHHKGWVSDRLSQAALELRNGAPINQVVSGLVDALRRGDPGGGEGRLGSGEAGRGAERADGAGSENSAGGSQARRSPEVLKVDLSFSTWRKHDTGRDGKIDVHVNPTDKTMANLSVLPVEERKPGSDRREVRLRYLRDANNNLFVWRGDLAIHEEVAKAMGLKIHPDDVGKKMGADTGLIDFENGKVLYDGKPERPGAPVPKRALREGGAEAWRDELVRPDASVDDIERVMTWLAGERKDVVEKVRALFLEEDPPAGAIKADLITELRQAVREKRVGETPRDQLPPDLFAADPDVARMQAAEEELRRPIEDQGATLALEIDADATRAVAADAMEIDRIEQDVRDLRKIEESDPNAVPLTYIDPETGKASPVAGVLDELDRDRQRLQVLEFCAYPGGKGGP